MGSGGVQGVKWENVGSHYYGEAEHVLLLGDVNRLGPNHVNVSGLS